jgi:hypothetical protein
LAPSDTIWLFDIHLAPEHQRKIGAVCPVHTQRLYMGRYKILTTSNIADTMEVQYSREPGVALLPAFIRHAAMTWLTAAAAWQFRQ